MKKNMKKQTKKVKSKKRRPLKKKGKLATKKDIKKVKKKKVVKSAKKKETKGVSKKASSKVNGFMDKLRNKLETDKKYRIASKVITTIMFLVGLYLVVYPFIPAILFKIFKEGREIYPYKTNLEEVVEEGEFAREEIPEENRLVLPTIGVDMAIVEGDDSSVLNLGVWHRPGTGTPGSGNLVLTGHRVGYAFLPEDVKSSTSFYNLDKLKIGDYAIIYWNQVEYDYEIISYEIVDKTATFIEAQDGEEKLTLYTCHPIGQNEKRLVYYGVRVETDLGDQNDQVDL
jgi:LPXTG-site transpeptidase (sortase) family protein